MCALDLIILTLIEKCVQFGAEFISDIGYKNSENTDKNNIFRKYDDRKPRKHAICHTGFSQPNPWGWQNY